MKKQLFHLYLNDDEYRKVLQALIALKNNLIEQGRYTDAVDDVLIKITKAKKETVYCPIQLNSHKVMPLVSLRRGRRLFCVLGQFYGQKNFFQNFSQK